MTQLDTFCNQLFGGNISEIVGWKLLLVPAQSTLASQQTSNGVGTGATQAFPFANLREAIRKYLDKRP